jgi:hypothetical protein
MVIYGIKDPSFGRIRHPKFRIRPNDADPDPKHLLKVIISSKIKNTDYDKGYGT